MLAQHRVDARRRVVDEHIVSEVEHRLDPLVATFGDAPEWHNKPGGQVMKGHGEIRDFYAALFEGFPDFSLDIHARHVADEAVIVQGELSGTHRGEWMGIAPTGRSVRVPFCAVFTFTDDDRLRSETAYYDSLTFLTQMGVTAPTA